MSGSGTITTKTELKCKHCGCPLYCEIKNACEDSDFMLTVYCDNEYDCYKFGVEYEKRLSLSEFVEV